MENLKELKRRKKEMRKEREKLNKEESKINNVIQKEETIPKMKKNIGKCYKYPLSKKYWLYTKITGVNKGCYITVDFHHSKDEYTENINIELQKYVSPYFPYDDTVEITEEEYNKAREKILKEIEEVI